ncbi:hypothetical protein [Paractinoplanes hotanensis]|uniref:Uncharacterized protein n=1 Tax=Paractinoplanes hotanensis TaxID=2906497 RepID=A0ABT0Y5B5_9ACTN|nr:hypothetical protein [Actinoplanes hotanensis]MCM4081239.1 hypothetical protein [Actinoplanes hotanensis]
MNDNPIAGRVRLLLGRTSIDSVTAVYPVIPSLTQSPSPSPSPEPESVSSCPPSPAVEPAQPAPTALPDEALQVLTLAQRTAQEYIAAASEQARAVREEAEKNADHSREEAHAYADRVRAEAEKSLTAARVEAEATNREALAQATEIRRQAERLLAEARAEADRIIAGGNDSAELLERQAQQRYEDAVGGLSVKRTALQEQIETLEAFDAEYRHRLMTFLQGQLRALWTDRPQPVEVPQAEPPAPGGPT